ncbi:MAG TPA: hypothetical protein PLY93_08420, partial [Turneriella sp.]|nr:hypothetical protein [Turneriella sp.]
MSRYTKIICFALLSVVACVQPAPAIDKTVVDQTLQDFTAERISYYLHDARPKTNREFLDIVLSRRGISIRSFAPELKRYYPNEYKQLMGE